MINIKKEFDNDSSRYSVQVFDTNKDEIEQPYVSEIELLPKFPTGILVVGRSGSGKTNAVVSLLSNKHMLKGYFDIVLLFTGIKPDKKLISSLNLKKNDIKVDFSEEDVSDVLTRAENTMDQKGMGDTPRLLMIFDDILGNPQFLKSKTMSKLVTTNRHMNISYIIMTQYYKKLPPVIRTNASYYMIFPSSEAECIKIADELTPPHYTKKQFLQILKHATTQKYNFLSINSKTEGSKQLRKNFDVILNV